MITNGQKQCRKCKQYKNVTEFHVCRSNKDGLQAMCKACVKEHAEWYRSTEHGKEVDRKHALKYIHSELGKETSRKYKQSEKGKEQRRRDATNRQQYKSQARTAVFHSINNGTLPKPTTLPCVVCGKSAECYHHWSYEPECQRSVIPLCRNCHGLIHRKYNPLLLEIKPEMIKTGRAFPSRIHD